MMIWEIKDNEFECAIEVGPVTILKGANRKWYELCRLIDDFFNNKNSNVIITEGAQRMYPKDWECFFIPFDAKVLLEKVTTKSPLRPLLDESVEEMSANPIVLELFTLWEELIEELKWINSNLMEKYNLELSLQMLSIEDLKKFLYFESNHKRLSPYEYKELFLELFLNRPADRKRLVLLEFPEFYASPEQIKAFLEKIYHYKDRGVLFLIVTDYDFEGHTNMIYEDVIINQANLEMIERKVLNDLPIYWDEMKYNDVANELLQLVDNCIKDNKKIELSTCVDLEKRIIFFTMMNHLNIKISVDTTGLPENLENYIQSYL